LPCIVVNHIYQTMELYSKSVISGGTSIIYSANQAFIISRSQEKDGTEVVGWNFTINVEKSRFVREKSKLTFMVNYEEGINKWSGLMDLALEFNFVIKPSNGWYSIVGQEDKKYRLADTMNEAFWKPILDDEKFRQAVKAKFQLANGMINNLEGDDA